MLELAVFAVRRTGKLTSNGISLVLNVRVLCFKAIAIEPGLPFMGNFFCRDTQGDPLRALNIDIQMTVVLRGFDLAAKHVENLDDPCGFFAIVQVGGNRFGQTIFDRWQFGICGWISNHRVQTVPDEPGDPLVDLLIGIEAQGFPGDAAELEVDMVIVLTLHDFTADAFQGRRGRFSFGGIFQVKRLPLRLAETDFLFAVAYRLCLGVYLAHDGLGLQ